MDLLLIGGVSGSGKSVALAALEDSGYYAVSNLPLAQLAGLLAHLKNARIDRVPLDADLVFDVRCLPNPHYEPALQMLSGRDSPVVAYLQNYPEVERMYQDIHRFIATWLPDYARDNRNYLTVAIGCTGGQHRSVYFVERLAKAFIGRYQVLTRHRELALPVE